MNAAGGEGLLLVAAAVGYLAASVGYGTHLLLRQASLARFAELTALTAVVLHTIAIGFHCALTRQTPLTTPAETLSASGWAIVLTYLILEVVRQPKPTALGAFVLPAAFLSVFAGAVLHRAVRAGTSLGTAGLAHVLDSNLISLHVLAILLAFGLLTLACGCAALYLIQHRLLKRKRVAGGLFGKLPPLASLEQLAFTLVAFAFPLLTVGLVAGAIGAAAGNLHSGWSTDLKILASFLTWLVYGLYLILHTVAHWRGPRASYLLLGGLLVALITYFVPTTSHRFG